MDTIERATVQTYDRIADRYAAIIETKPHNAYYDRPAVVSLWPDVAGLDVLDAGCGPGVYAELLLERGARVTAGDVSSRMRELAAERLGDRAPVIELDLAARLSCLTAHSISSTPRYASTMSGTGVTRSRSSAAC